MDSAFYERQSVQVKSLQAEMIIGALLGTRTFSSGLSNTEAVNIERCEKRKDLSILAFQYHEAHTRLKINTQTIRTCKSCTAKRLERTVTPD